MAVNVGAVITLILFYLAILVIGIIAARKTSKSQTTESVMVADRSLGYVVTCFTITATVVGGAYINGIAESVALDGLLKAQVPVGFGIAIFAESFIFVPTMRKAGYVTMIDPFQLKYGRKVGALMVIPQAIGDIFWAAAIFSALGGTISVIMEIDPTLAIGVSATVACIYTFFGGLYSVAYTDVIQLAFIVIGLVIALPFALANPAVNLPKVTDTSKWFGSIPSNAIAHYIDDFLLFIFGGMMWQPYFQRALACRSMRVARLGSIFGAIFALAMAIPSIAFGIVGKSADWNQTSYDGSVPLPTSMNSYILPLALNYLTPSPVAITGVAALSAAVMSSADSAILSTSSTLTKNIYQDVFRPHAGEREMRWAMRTNVVLTTLVSTLLAILSKSVYGLMVLCVDCSYAILFPQMIAVLWVRSSNAYGSVAGYLVAFVLRMLCGESLLSMPAAIRFPLYDEETGTQYFPYRTFVMVVGALVLFSVSMVTNAIFRHGLVPVRFDVLSCTAKRTAGIRKRSWSVECPEDQEAAMELATQGKAV